jgi:hypothetical protein
MKSPLSRLKSDFSRLKNHEKSPQQASSPNLKIFVKTWPSFCGVVGGHLKNERILHQH